MYVYIYGVRFSRTDLPSVQIAPSATQLAVRRPPGAGSRWRSNLGCCWGAVGCRPVLRARI